MADLKISQLTDGGNAQATDEYVIARSGANYRIDGASVAAAATSVGTLSSLTVSGATSTSALTATGTAAALAANSVVLDNSGGFARIIAVGPDASTAGKLRFAVSATDASPFTIAAEIDASGNLAVDTNTLYVDAANNRVGIGTASPSDKLEVSFGTNGYIIASNTTDTNTGIKLTNTGRSYGIFTDGGSGASNSLRFYDFTASAERMRLDSSGNLAVGTTSANSYRLRVYGGNDNTLVIDNDGSRYTTTNIANNGTTKSSLYWDNTNTSLSLYATAASSQLIFGTANIERMRLDASGNLGVGTTSPSGALHVLRASAYPYQLMDAFGAGYYPLFDFRSSRNSTAGSFTATNSGDTLLLMRASGTNSGNTAFAQAASISVLQTSTAGATYVPAALTFGTSDGTNAVTERARITSGGYFKASNDGTYYSSAGTYHELRQNSSTDYIWIATHTHASQPAGFQIYYSGASPNGTGNQFINCTDSTALRAAIRSNGGLANYQANDVNLSDERAKTDIKPVGSYWDKFKAIEIVTFKYKDQTHDDDNIGVIAQQVEAVAPEFIDVDGFGETPEDGVPLKTVYTTDMYHASIKALQEAMARIESLEARLAALEN